MTKDETQEYTLRAMARNYAGGHTWDKLDGETAINAADEIRALRAALAASSHPIVCRVMPMKLSSGETDYYVSIERDGRQITPHKHKIKGCAEYEVAEWNHVLNGAGEPDILAFDCDEPATAPAAEGGWIEWAGGEQPVANDVRVLYRMADGLIDTDARRADSLRWDRWGSAGDIIAYRVVAP